MKSRSHRYAASAAEGPSYVEQVALLLFVAEQAIDAGPEADAAIRVCGTVSRVPDQAAVDLGHCLRDYSRLYHRLEGFTPDPDLAQVHGDLMGQLSYHLHMLRDAGDLVFCGRPVAVNERFRRELANGLGPHALGLELLRRALRARLAAAEAGPSVG
ncbi:MAG TPA: hypothetical protein VL551_23885 [Actinospica sp.]|nr:hypothetical protein [Actinospica sp.]